MFVWIKPSHSLAGPDFVPGIKGLPIIPGFAVIPETQVVFNSAIGRIVEVSLSGRLSATKVLLYYADTLPQLGWKRASKYKFIRDSEVLKLSVFQRKENIVNIRFSVRAEQK